MLQRQQHLSCVNEFFLRNDVMCHIIRHNLQSGVLLPFLFGRQGKMMPDTLIYFTHHLPIVQNLDFCLIGRKTKDPLQPCTDWSSKISGFQCYKIGFVTVVSLFLTETRR